MDNESNEKGYMPTKEWMQDYLKNTIKELQKEGAVKDNSFIFLEGITLQRMILPLLMNLDMTHYQENKRFTANSTDFDNILTDIDSMMEDHENAFIEIIEMLKEQA